MNATTFALPRSIAMNLLYEDLARAHTNEQLALAEKRRLAKQVRRRSRRRRWWDVDRPAA